MAGIVDTLAARPAWQRAALVAAVYAVPLTVVVVLLATHGLAELAVGLVVVEASVVTGIRLARRPPRAPVRERAPGEPVLGLPGDRPAGSGGRAAVLLAVGLVAIVLLIGLGIALAS